MPTQTGAVDGIITFTETPKKYNITAKEVANKLEKIKLIKRNCILLVFLIGNVCRNICSCGGIFRFFSLKLFYSFIHNFS